MRDRTTEGVSGRLLASGRYLLGARLGGGGTAEVFRAVDTVLDRHVAIKLFRAGSGVRDEQRFIQEARLLAPLNHPGLVTVFDAGVGDGGQAFLVLQLVDGVTLRQRLGRGRMRPHEVAELGARLASVLAYVHAKGIVHRDVKPSNVLIGGDGDVHLADFGISRLIDTAHVTATGLVVGTVAYMAPEQVRGQDVGPPADMYSLGLVLLECLTGRPEYPGGSADAAVTRLSRRPHIPGGLPDRLRWVLSALTRDEPEERLSARKCAAMLSDGGAGSGEVSTDFLVQDVPAPPPGDQPAAAVPPSDGPVPPSASGAVSASGASPAVATGPSADAGQVAPAQASAGAKVGPVTQVQASRPTARRNAGRWLLCGAGGLALVAVLTILTERTLGPSQRQPNRPSIVDGPTAPSRQPHRAPGGADGRPAPQASHWSSPPSTGADSAGVSADPVATPSNGESPGTGPGKPPKTKPPKTKPSKPPKTKPPKPRKTKPPITPTLPPLPLSQIADQTANDGFGGLRPQVRTWRQIVSLGG